MSLLSICQNVARGYTEIPTTIINSTNDTSRKLLTAAQTAGKAIARLPEEGWVDMQVEYTFNTVASQDDYNLPSDFRWLIDGTLWDRANYWELRGPMSPRDWQRVKSSVLGDTDTNRKRFRIRNVSGTTQFSLHPTPDNNTDTLVFEYASKNWCESSGGTGQEEWLADDDVGVIDEYLIELEARWRFLRLLRLDYDEEKAEAEAEISKAAARSGGMKIFTIGGKKTFTFISSANVPDSGFGQ